MHTQIISGRGQLLRSLVVMLAVVVLQQHGSERGRRASRDCVPPRQRQPLTPVAARPGQKLLPRAVHSLHRSDLLQDVLRHCKPPVKTVLKVMNPITCCPVDVPVCLPACCEGCPAVDSRCGMLVPGRGHLRLVLRISRGGPLRPLRRRDGRVSRLDEKSGHE